MRVVIFWNMCHLSLGHEKKALLMCTFPVKVKPSEMCSLPVFVMMSHS